MGYDRNAAPMDPEEQATMMLAYYDVREVSDIQLSRIFNCTVGALAEVRKTDQYGNHLQSFQAEIVERETTLDDGWDDLERKALGSLQETVEAVGDPRMLLAMAKTANIAQRRGGTMSKIQQRKGSSVIDVDKQAGPTKIVRLRTKFLEIMQSDTGAQRMVEREVEITKTVVGNSSDVNEDLKPSEVKHLLQHSLGVDASAVRVSNRFGPDVDILADGLPMIDFSTFDVENPLE